MAKKLFQVTAELTTFVMAEDEKEARQVGADAFESEGIHDSDCNASKVKHRDIALDGRWDYECLVYGADEDTKLGDALAPLPESEMGKKLRAYQEAQNSKK